MGSSAEIALRSKSRTSASVARSRAVTIGALHRGLERHAMPRPVWLALLAAASLMPVVSAAGPCVAAIAVVRAGIQAPLAMISYAIREIDGASSLPSQARAVAGCDCC
jgi:hypothetical protein